MTPAELDAWWNWLKAKLPSRNSHLWRWSWILGGVIYVAQTPGLWPPGHAIPPEWAAWVQNVAVAVMAIGGKMASSPAKSPQKDG